MAQLVFLACVAASLLTSTSGEALRAAKSEEFPRELAAADPRCLHKAAGTYCVASEEERAWRLARLAAGGTVSACTDSYYRCNARGKLVAGTERTPGNVLCEYSLTAGEGSIGHFVASSHEVCVAPTPSVTPSSSVTATGTSTATPSASETATSTGTGTATPTATQTATSTPTPTATETSTGTSTPTPTSSETGTGTGTASATATSTGSSSATATSTGSATASQTPSSTSSATSSETATVTPSSTATPTATRTASQSPNCPNLGSGVLTGLSRSQLTCGGWRVCHDSWYGTGYGGTAGSPISNVLSACNGRDVLVACYATTSPTLLNVAAWAPRSDVFFDTGINSNVVHNANGVSWYFNQERSFGFAPQGEVVSKNSCDTASSNGDKRLCIHAWSASFQYGYRCGNNFLNNGYSSSTGQQMNRVIFTR